MVRYHGEDRFEAVDGPQRLEAGTPAIEGCSRAGRGGGLPAGPGHGRRGGAFAPLGAHLAEGLRALPGVRHPRGLGPCGAAHRPGHLRRRRAGLGADALARLLCDRYQILVSGGYHCAHILHHRLHSAGTVRASTHVFNTHEEIDRLLAALRELVC